MLAYFINLDSRPDRRAFMEAQLSALDMKVERLSATTPDQIVPADVAPLSLGDIGQRLSPPEIAVSISHFRIWKHMLELGEPRVLVLEDDQLLSQRLPSFLSAIESNPVGVDVLRLETRQLRVQISTRGEPAPEGLSFHCPFSFEDGAGAYVVSAAFAARVLASRKRFSMPVDDIMFSLDSPFRRGSTRRVVVPGLSLCRYEVTPEFAVPPGILASDIHAARVALNEARMRRLPLGPRKLWREFVRLGTQSRRAVDALRNALLGRTTVIPFADTEFSVRSSAARPPA